MDLGGTGSSNFKVGLGNCFSLKNKVNSIMGMMVESGIGILCLTETWLGVDESAVAVEIKEWKHQLVSVPRKGRKGGGVALILRDSIKFTRCHASTKSFECLEVFIKGKAGVRLAVIYRTGSDHSAFLLEFEDYLSSFVSKGGVPIVLGDFNVRYQDDSDGFTQKFKSLVAKEGWLQHVKGPTHIKGGTLDLVLTRDSNEATLVDIDVYQAPALPDHSLVSFGLNVLGPSSTGDYKLVTNRRMKDFDIEDLREDILQSDLCDELPEGLDECVELYNTILTGLMDKRAPVVTRKVQTRNDQWYTQNYEICQEQKRKRRRAERKYRAILKNSTNAEDINAHRIECRRQTKETEKFLMDVREKYFADRLEAEQHDPKATWRTANYLLGRQQAEVLPGNIEKENLADAFMGSFQGKVEKIYRRMEDRRKAMGVKDESVGRVNSLRPEPTFQFKRVSDEVLRTTIKAMGTKHCALDPFPTSFVSKLFGELLPVLSKIVNDSLLSGVFPEALKTALIRPTIKKADLDQDDLGNYRPVSNLPFIGKLIEKCAADQFVGHLEENGLLSKKQSAYRRNMSCETATLRIYDDLLTLTDEKTKVVLLLLDLSAAFDTVNHGTLLRRLEQLYGVTGNSLDWFRSYLTGRTASVNVAGMKSALVELSIGVPQGSILGPILFICYTKELELIAEKHGVAIHFYADDTQVYAAYSCDEFAALEKKLRACVADIQDWLTNNFLQLNPTKTEVLILSPRGDPEEKLIDLFDGADPLPTAVSARNLGVRFDTKLNFDSHVSKVVRSCKATLVNLWRIAGKLSLKLRTTLVTSLIHGQLDFCNSLMMGMSKKNVNELQKVQNAAARFVFRQRRWRGTTELRKTLHFLPVERRIQFKVCVQVYKCLNGLAPEYLSSLLQKRKRKAIGLRADRDELLLETPQTKYRITERAFRVSGPRLWNKLPKDLRGVDSLQEFKKGLKTHLFKAAFD